MLCRWKAMNHRLNTWGSFGHIFVTSRYYLENSGISACWYWALLIFGWASLLLFCYLMVVFASLLPCPIGKDHGTVRSVSVWNPIAVLWYRWIVSVIVMCQYLIHLYCLRLHTFWRLWFGNAAALLLILLLSDFIFVACCLWKPLGYIWSPHAFVILEPVMFSCAGSKYNGRSFGVVTSSLTWTVELWNWSNLSDHQIQQLKI
jgi:hypothetical protein